MDNTKAYRRSIWRLTFAVLVMVSLFALCGCGSSDGSSGTQEDTKTAHTETDTAQTDAGDQEKKADMSDAAGALSGSSNDGSGAEQYLVRIEEEDGYANVRTGRGTEYDSVGKLYNGKVVAVKGPTNEWLEIVSGEYAGRFIHRSTVSFDWDKESTVFQQFVSSSDGEANIRTGRGTQYSTVGKLYNGASVYVSDLKDGWYRIQYGEYAGKYIHRSVLSDLQPQMTSEDMFYVSEPDGYANVRTGRGTKYDVIGKLPNGTAVYVTSLHEGWYLITRGSLKGGYISASTLVR